MLLERRWEFCLGKNLLGLAVSVECVPSLEGVVCCLNVPFPAHQNAKQRVRKGSESCTRGDLWRPKVGKM